MLRRSFRPDERASEGAAGAHARVVASLDALLQELHSQLRSGDQVLIMSNGGFGGLHTLLLSALRGAGA